jgi:hypothetical protein
MPDWSTHVGGEDSLDIHYLLDNNFSPNNYAQHLDGDFSMPEFVTSTDFAFRSSMDEKKVPDNAFCKVPSLYFNSVNHHPKYHLLNRQ